MAAACCDTSILAVVEQDVDARWSAFPVDTGIRKQPRRWVTFLAGLLVSAVVLLGAQQLSRSAPPPRADLASGGGGVIGFSPSGQQVPEHDHESPFGDWVAFHFPVEPDTLWWMVPIFNQGTLPVTILHLGPPAGAYPRVARAFLVRAPNASWTAVQPFKATTIRPRGLSTFELRIALHCDGLGPSESTQYGTVPVTYSYGGTTRTAALPVTMAQLDGPSVCIRGR